MTRSVGREGENKVSRTIRNVIIFLFGFCMLGIGVYSWVEKNLGDRPFSGIITEWGASAEERQIREGVLPTTGVNSLRVKSVNGKAKIIPVDEGSEIKFAATLWARGSNASEKLSNISLTSEISGEIGRASCRERV